MPIHITSGLVALNSVEPALWHFIHLLSSWAYDYLHPTFFMYFHCPKLPTISVIPEQVKKAVKSLTFPYHNLRSVSF